MSESVDGDINLIRYMSSDGVFTHKEKRAYIKKEFQVLRNKHKLRAKVFYYAYYIMFCVYAVIQACHLVMNALASSLDSVPMRTRLLSICALGLSGVATLVITMICPHFQKAHTSSMEALKVLDRQMMADEDFELVGLCPGGPQPPFPLGQTSGLAV